MAWEKFNCPLCNVSLTHKLLCKHIAAEHQQEPSRVYSETFVLTDNDYCPCGCNQLSSWKNWKEGFTGNYIRGHNARIDSAWFDSDKQTEMALKRKQGYSENKYQVWNKGLTNKTDSRIQDLHDKASDTLTNKYKSGEIVAWQSGLTKETDERIERIAKTKLGKPTWNKGLRKSTSGQLTAIAKKISAVKQNENTFNFPRLTPDEVRKRFNDANNFEVISSFDDYQNKYQLFEVLCKDCRQTSWKSVVHIVNSPICFHCSPKESIGQLEIYQFVLSLDKSAVLSDRTLIAPKEIDIFVPSQNFAIEFNGIFYHSDACLNDKNYHQKKTEQCSKLGVSLMHVFEDEWRDKQEIVKSMIRHRLKLSFLLNARDCVFRIVSLKERQDFFENSHIDGDANAKIAFGLFDKNNELVSCLSLRNPFGKKTQTIEIARYACKLNTAVRGSLSRLLKHAKAWAKDNDFDTIMTYADLRHGSGKGYQASGFVYVKDTTTERFWWTDFMHRYNRLKFTANKSLNLSENDVANLAGVVKIYGCKNRHFEMSI